MISLLAITAAAFVGAAQPNFSALLSSGDSKGEIHPIRQAKVHYTLIQRWTDKTEQEEKVCEGDTTAPVFDLKVGETIASSDFVNVICTADAKPGVKSGEIADRKLDVKMNLFVIYMNADIFVTATKTKNFVAFVGPDSVRAVTTGFVSFTDLNQKAVDLQTNSVPRFDDKYQLDGSTYVVSARYTDDAPAP